jgi:Na+-transporting NADH:ubiquinone oxidoreductase subunit F
MAKLRVEMEIERATMELPDTKTLRLKWPEDYPVDFLTGQFITVYWPHKQKYKRAYSLSSSALDRGHFEITIKRDGKMGTSLVDWAEEGDSLWVIEPTGRFLPVLDPPDKHLICIAGGSGVTPFRAFVREATQLKLATKITVLYSVRTTHDVIFDEEFRALEKENPNFEFLVTCTRLADNDPWEGRRGRIDAAWVKEQVGDLENTIFYACGPNALVDFSTNLVRDGLGVGKEQMLIEKWG